MLLVKIELHSAIDGSIKEIGQLRICNVGGTLSVGAYKGEILTGGRRLKGEVNRFHRRTVSVWKLVQLMLDSCFSGDSNAHQNDNETN